MRLIDEAYEHALSVLRHCVTPAGFYASGLPGGYEAVWARDSMITSLGASMTGDAFHAPFKKSVELLTRHQSARGQIPNAVGSYNAERRSDVTFNSIDSTLWYLIGHRVYARAYRDFSLQKRFKKNIVNAFAWLAYQDPNEDELIVQQPTMDWQDAFPHKYGRVLSTQALHYAALRMHGKDMQAERLKRVVNGERKQYLSLWDSGLGYYRPWRWKTHNAFREEGAWFDTFGNLLAVVVGLATPRMSARIMRHIRKRAIDTPFPCRAIDPPLMPQDKEWQNYFEDCEARTPYHYLNAGVWPFIGGFYVAALVKIGEARRAMQALESVAHANKMGSNREWGFQEWLHGKTGKPEGRSNPYQGWSGGMYVYAYECVKRGSVEEFC